MKKVKKGIIFVFSCILLSACVNDKYIKTIYKEGEIYGIEKFDQNIVSNDDDTNILVIGDTGTGTSQQYMVADILMGEHRYNKIDLAIHTGDLFYENGIESVDDINIKTKFEDVYNVENLKGFDWYIAAGNHDYRGNIQAIVNYSLQNDTILKMPSLYYKINTKTLGYEHDVDIYILDSEQFKDFGGTKVEQMEWLEKNLKSSTANYKFIVTHHPLKTAGKHSGSKTLYEQLNPLAIKYGVNLFLAGHNHQLEIQNDGVNDINYIVSGAGAKLRDSGVVEDTLFVASHYGAFLIKINGQGLYIKPLMNDDVSLYLKLN
jgi:predicted phosphodiesterase